eukprot:TRINITY_DN26534_c0_g1_i1.p1 TRINITY_DN26534_c0_g1~~TRINITY_DN26534_c0_g1_i1.p1  ORF type:complete len:233 (-),score=25.87 TRINITY_DN26534_c0_g1_i1:210-908(-)
MFSVIILQVMASAYHSELRDEFIIVALSFLESTSACAAATAASRTWQAAADSSLVWEVLCEACWGKKVSAFHLTSGRRRKLAESHKTWKEHYRDHLLDGRRASITRDELCACTFDFTFRLDPFHRVASRSFRFGLDGRVSGHPNGLTYDWELSEDGRHVALGQFPVGTVHRRPDWGWAIANVNIVCHSLDALDVYVRSEFVNAGQSSNASHSRLRSSAELFPDLFVDEYVLW